MRSVLHLSTSTGSLCCTSNKSLVFTSPMDIILLWKVASGGKIMFTGMIPLLAVEIKSISVG